MQVTLPYKLVLIKRGEGSKTPACVLPHEVEVLKALHGDENVIDTNDKLPEGLTEKTFDTEDEYARLQQYYRGNGSTAPANPTVFVWRNLDEFESAFAPVVGESKDELLARAQELGIDANGRWSVKKLKDAIEAAEAE